MDCYDEWCNKYDNGGKWKWKNPKRFMQNFIPQRDKNIIVFFQTTDSDFKDENGIGYIEKITWAIDENGLSNFHRFYTSYYPSDKTELIEFIKQKKL